MGNFRIDNLAVFILGLGKRRARKILKVFDHLGYQMLLYEYVYHEGVDNREMRNGQQSAV